MTKYLCLPIVASEDPRDLLFEYMKPCLEDSGIVLGWCVLLGSSRDSEFGERDGRLAGRH